MEAKETTTLKKLREYVNSVKSVLKRDKGPLWIGETPSIVMKKRVVERTGLKDENLIIKKLNHIEIMDLAKNSEFRDMFCFKKKKLYLKRHGLQEITRNNHFENELLKKSMLGIYPHEVFQIRYFTQDNKVVMDKIHHGGKFSFGSKLRMIKCLKKLLFKSGKERRNISLIEINHTHPTLEYFSITDEKKALFLNALSTSDIESVIEISKCFNVPIRLKAITPTGINYSMVFEGKKANQSKFAA